MWIVILYVAVIFGRILFLLILSKILRNDAIKWKETILMGWGEIPGPITIVMALIGENLSLPSFFFKFYFSSIGQKSQLGSGLLCRRRRSHLVSGEPLWSPHERRVKVNRQLRWRRRNKRNVVFNDERESYSNSFATLWSWTAKNFLLWRWCSYSR